LFDDEEDGGGQASEMTANISEEYKLFEVVTNAYPKQVLRYTSPQNVGIEPLWTSDKQRINAKDIPKCQNCGAKRTLELQITP